MDDRNRVSPERAADRVVNSASADKAKGRVEQAIGKIKQKVGSVVGNEKLEAKGAIQRAEGKKDELKGEIKEKIDDAKSYVKAGVEVVKEKVDEVRRKAH